MAAISARSNANSPKSPQTICKGDSGDKVHRRRFPFGTAAQEYSRDQLAHFIREQAKIGASPRKISVHYKFFDSDDNPGLSDNIIAKWISMPASGIADWFDANSQAHVTLRREQLELTGVDHPALAALKAEYSTFSAEVSSLCSKLAIDQLECRRLGPSNVCPKAS
jgi:hypothetical protein